MDEILDVNGVLAAQGLVEEGCCEQLVAALEEATVQSVNLRIRRPISLVAAGVYGNAVSSPSGCAAAACICAERDLAFERRPSSGNLNAVWEIGQCSADDIVVWEEAVLNTNSDKFHGSEWYDWSASDG
eukprot:TRINITY_DN41179_c0_g1_i1.p1 TRINITY_DN41179_c0_g1~~TRINITY_DN41179_c0_g1_i1.p1  ORF type:complete len:136 (+),score=16.11 TRINITY_DN41179_c0_g1_i1:24-410(+)